MTASYKIPGLTDTVGAAPTLGYLVAMTVRDREVVNDDYTALLDGLQAEGLINADQYKTLGIGGRSPAQAYQAALREWEAQADKPRRGVRWYVRQAKGARTDIQVPRYLIREEVGAKGVAVQQQSVMEVRFRPATLRKSAALGLVAQVDAVSPEALAGEIKAQSDALVRLFHRELTCFPSRLVRAALARLMEDQCPIGYDPEHRFKFVLYDRKPVVAALWRVIEFLNAGQRRTSGISIMPVGDYKETRAALTESFERELAEAVATAEDAVAEYRAAPTAAETLDPAKLPDLAGVLRRLAEANDRIALYQTSALAASSAVEAALGNVQQQVRRLIALDTIENAPGKVYEAKLETPAATLRAHLEQYAQQSVSFSRYDEVLAWQKGYGAAARPMLCQDLLLDPARVRVTLEQPPTDSLKAALGPQLVKLPVGWCYTGPADTATLSALTDWWNQVA